ncbi:MAG TPA: right-handed parallel beta-helix repeat-containing protein [Opitutaceae bacterium]|nr:right-handed parallel beta-helix repeat-containing protein [Opitutaceae bacterium]
MKPLSRWFPAFFLVGGSLAFLSGVSAQPSGGPYGPLPQTYEVPRDAAHVYYVAPDGQAAADGASLAAPTTLEAAIAKVVTGDAIILRGGTYRTGGLRLNQGITLQPYRDEQPVLKGTRIADQWDRLNDGVWRTKWATLFPQKPADWWRRHREGMRTPLHKFNNDMVFVDGKPLRSEFWEGGLDGDSYSIDYDGGYVYIKFDPAGRQIEITAQDSALIRVTAEVHGKKSDHKGYTMRGLTLTQYAYRALEIDGKRDTVPAGVEPTDDPVGVADPSTFGKQVVGTTYEHMAITHCSRVAGYFRGDGFVMRHCLISDTSTEGLYLMASSDCLIEKNIFTRNNIEKITGYYPSAVKIFNQTHRVVCRDNLVIDNPNSNGIWYDVGNVDAVFVNNRIENCLDGFFFEISKRVIVAGNVFVNCDKGLRILNASGARVYHNTFVNTVASFERDTRSAVGDHFGWHPATGPDVHERDGHVFSGNLLVADAAFTKALLRADQAPALKEKLTKPPFATVDYNLYARPASDAAPTLIVWSPATGSANQYMFKSPAELQQKLPAFEAHSELLPLAPDAVLENPAQKRYAPGRSLPVKSPLPAEIAALLGWPRQDSYTPGAYQVK